MERIVLADAYYKLDRIADAKAQWELAIAQDPKLGTAIFHGIIGQRLLRAKAYRDALPHLQRAHELEPQNATYRMDYERTRTAP